MTGRFLQDDLPAFFNSGEFADDAVYRPAGGRSFALKVIFDRPVEDSALGRIGVQAAALQCLVKSCDIAGITVARGDRIVIRGTAYDVVQGKPDLSGDVTLIELNEAA